MVLINRDRAPARHLGRTCCRRACRRSSPVKGKVFVECPRCTGQGTQLFCSVARPEAQDGREHTSTTKAMQNRLTAQDRLRWRGLRRQGRRRYGGLGGIGDGSGGGDGDGSKGGGEGICGEADGIAAGWVAATGDGDDGGGTGKGGDDSGCG